MNNTLTNIGVDVRIDPNSLLNLGITLSVVIVLFFVSLYAYNKL